MRIPERYLVVYFCTFFLLLVAWSLALHLLNQKESFWNFSFNVGYGLLYLNGGVIALIRSFKVGLKTSVGKQLLSMGVALTGFALGLFAWAYYNIVLKIDIPYPSLADAFFILYIPFLAYGLVDLISIFKVNFPKMVYLESIAVFFLYGYVIFMIGNPPDISPSVPVLARLFNILYLMGDCFLITLGYAITRVTHGKTHKSFIYFIVALFMMAFADLVFSYTTARSTYYNGGIADVMYAFSGLLFSLGVVKFVSTLDMIDSLFPSLKQNSTKVN